MPKISVVMSSYNHEGFIEQAVSSVLNQTFQDFELIVIDDCSSDATYSKLEAIGDPRIRCFKAPYNRGMVQNINEAIRLSKGDYIAHLNSDDFWEPQKLQTQVEFMDENTEYGAVFTDLSLVDELGQECVNDEFKAKFLTENRAVEDWLNYWFFYGNCLCFTSAMIRKSCFDKVGVYNPGFIILLDFDMWVRLCLAGFKIHVIDEKLTNFRLLERGCNLGMVPNRANLSLLEYGKVIEHYLKIDDADLFSRIFPAYRKSLSGEEDIQYCLFDMLMSELKSSRVQGKYLERLKWGFLVKSLFDVFAKDTTAWKVMNDKFGFTFKQYVDLSTGHDVSKLNGGGAPLKPKDKKKSKRLKKYLLQAYVVVSALLLLSIVFFG